MAKERDSVDKSVPNTVPLVAFDENDEPFIVRTSLIKQSPLPYWVAALVIVMMSISFGYIVYSEGERDKALDCELDRDRALAIQLTDYQGIQDADRQRIKNLVASVANAKQRTEVRAAFDAFLESEKQFTTLREEARRDIRETIETNCGRG